MTKELDDVLAWLKPKLDRAQKDVYEAERDYKDVMSGDLGIYQCIAAQARLSALVEVKVGIERYKKKIKHEKEKTSEH